MCSASGSSLGAGRYRELGKVRGRGQTGASVKASAETAIFRRQRGPVLAAPAQMVFGLEENLHKAISSKRYR